MAGVSTDAEPTPEPVQGTPATRAAARAAQQPRHPGLSNADRGQPPGKAVAQSRPAFVPHLTLANNPETAGRAPAATGVRSQHDDGQQKTPATTLSTTHDPRTVLHDVTM